MCFYIIFFYLKIGGASKAEVDKNSKRVQNALEAVKVATDDGTLLGN